MTTQSSPAARDVDAYLAALPDEPRAALELLRRAIRAAAPDAIEVISYRMPTFKLRGRSLVAFAAFKRHCSLFPMSLAVVEAFKDDLSAYEAEKGTIRFTAGRPLPEALVRKLVEARIAENDARANARKGRKQTMVTTNSEPTPGREILITRVFDAPRELVFKAWTDPGMLMRWWGPKSFTAPHCAIDLRVGGKYLFCMRSPEGQDYWSTGVYREIVPPERLVMTDSFADADGNVVPATHYGMGADIPLELHVTVTFEEFEGKTRMTLRHVGFPPGEMSDLVGAGWNESFDKLAEALK